VVDLSYNCLTSLKYLSNLKYIREIKATNNQLITILDMKVLPLYLDTVDLSSNGIISIPNLEKNKFLRVLKLQNNKIVSISGIDKNKNLQILDISENCLEEIKGLDNLNLT
jgi:protein phosphatase 1 regulatory subunit 7